MVYSIQRVWKKGVDISGGGERREAYRAETDCQRALSVDLEEYTTSLVAQEVRESPQRGESAKVEVPSGYGRVEGRIGSA